MKRYDWGRCGMTLAGDGEWVLRDDVEKAVAELVETLRETTRIRDCKLSAANYGWDDAERIWTSVDAAIEKFTPPAAGASPE